MQPLAAPTYQQAACQPRKYLNRLDRASRMAWHVTKCVTLRLRHILTWSVTMHASCQIRKPLIRRARGGWHGTC